MNSGKGKVQQCPGRLGTPYVTGLPKRLPFSTGLPGDPSNETPPPERVERDPPTGRAYAP